MRKPISKEEIPAIEIIEKKVKDLAPDVTIEEIVEAEVGKEGQTIWSVCIPLTWRGTTKDFVLRRSLLDDLRDAPSQHDENWQKLMKELSTQIAQSLQELNYHTGKTGFIR